MMWKILNYKLTKYRENRKICTKIDLFYVQIIFYVNFLYLFI